MPTTLSGFPVLSGWDDPKLITKVIPGTNIKMLGNKDYMPLFLAFASEWNQRIAPLHECESYDYRQARAASAWSDHSGGVAMDVNASHEGRLGTGPYSWWKGEKSATMRDMLKKYKVLNWGGSTDLGGQYTLASDTDWMHIYIKKGTTMQQVHDVMQELGIDQDGHIDLSGVPKGHGTPNPQEKTVDVAKGSAAAQKRKAAMDTDKDGKVTPKERGVFRKAHGKKPL
jgi:hypothetical protein